MLFRSQLKWQKYSAALKRTDVKDIAPIIVAKEEAQDELYAVIIGYRILLQIWLIDYITIYIKNSIITLCSITCF